MKATALITPSWLPDIDRCAQLMDSATRHTTGFSKHYLLVDAIDERTFRSQLGGDCEIVVKEDLLPSWLHQSSLNRKWWWSLRALPVRGWILQQITKIAITQHLEEEAFCFADSDTRFVRDFSAEQLWQGDKLCFFRDSRKAHFYQNRRYKNWYRYAANHFDLGNEQLLDGSYIAQLTSMRKDTVSKMLETIEQNNNRSWLEVLIRSLDFSEFVLYGVFVDECLKGAGHIGQQKSFCHSSWFFEIQNQQDIASFVTQVRAEQVAVHLQSNLNFDPLALELALNG